MAGASESRAVAQGRGKWSRPDIPHEGWTCVRIEDRLTPTDICGMCESQPIRYVHHMAHPHYPAELAVGCVCAGHMENDLEQARARDNAMVRRAKKRTLWLDRRWKISDRGSEWIEADGYRVVVFRTLSTWAAIISEIDGGYRRESKLPYSTSDDVKLASFDVITHRLSRKG